MNHLEGGRPNPKLVDIGNYPMLTTIGGDFSIYDNDSLKSIVNLGALHTIGGSFSVTNNNNLQSLDGFPTLRSIGIDINNVSIVIENNSNLSDCCLLVDFFNGGVYELSGEIYIANNATTCNHQDIIKSECIIYQGDINVATQTEVEELSALLSEKTKIDGNVEIIEADGTSDPITDLSVFNTIDTITGNLMIQNLSMLDSIIGNFNALQSIKGYLNIQNNAAPHHIRKPS